LKAAGPFLPESSPGASPVALRRDAQGAWIATLAGEDLTLLPERALHWPRVSTLIVADVHLGKAASFRAGGIPIPRGTTASDLSRLSVLIERTRAARLIVLGDFLHAPEGRVAALDAAIRAWRQAHAALALTLVRGNHDERAGDPPASWGVEVVDAPHSLAPFALYHEPATPPTGYALCGHVHPGARLSSAAGDSARLPCFVLGPRRALLPAFGRLTGLHMIAGRVSETRVVIAASTLYPLPSTG
jgi:DNA ligase-associated metallophosphoesterase